MAIIKFITKTDCRVYIDTDYIGFLKSGKMLKTSLETGTYLVVAKDTNDQLIKQYELRVNGVDAQILQDISEDNYDDVIKRLMNDPSIQFHNQRAVFGFKGLFGYINSQYQIAIKPIYSNADDYSSERAFVRRMFPDGEKCTVIDINGNIILSKWYDFIGSNDSTILLKDNNKYLVLNRNGYIVQSELYDAGYDGHNNYIPAYKSLGTEDYYGFINIFGEEVIPFIYDYVWNFKEDGYAKVKRFGLTHVVDKDGTLFGSEDDWNRNRLSKANSGEAEDNNCEKSYNIISKLSLEESIYRGFSGNYCLDEYYWWDDFPLKKGNYWGLGLLEDHECDVTLDSNRTFLCDRILYYDNGYLAYKKDGACMLLNIASPEKIYSFEFDFITPNFLHYWNPLYAESSDELCNIIVKKNQKYGIINLEGKIILPLNFDLIDTIDVSIDCTKGKIGILWKDGKCALLSMEDGELLFPIKYNKILVNADATFLIKEDEKYGFMDEERKIIIPTVYDSITYETKSHSDNRIVEKHYMMLLCKDGKYGTFELRDSRTYFSRDRFYSNKMEFFVEPQYDECVFLEYSGSVNSAFHMSCIAVRKDDKWGIIDNTPIKGTYYPINSSDWENKPNLKDLKFKYESLDELKNDMKEEFTRRQKKYKRPHTIVDMGNYLEAFIIKEEDESV